jgi:hypothetical protein
MELSGREILYSLKTVRWDTALRTYGNNHATLIGLLVDWWVSGAPEHRWALESGPTNGYAAPGVRGQCDALFCCDHAPLGVLEVEGYRYQRGRLGPSSTDSIRRSNRYDLASSFSTRMKCSAVAPNELSRPPLSRRLLRRSDTLRNATPPNPLSSSHWTRRINGFVRGYAHKTSITRESPAESKAFCMKMARQWTSFYSKPVSPANPYEAPRCQETHFP